MAKAKGKEKPTASTVVPAEVNEAAVDDVTTESSPSKAVNIQDETTIDTGSGKPEETDKPKEEPEELVDAEMTEQAKVDEEVEAVLATDTPAGEKSEEGAEKEETKSNEKVENASNKKSKRKRNRKKTTAIGAASNDAEKLETSDPKKPGKKADGMGLIFHCSAKTKKDCDEYKIFGLPKNKKELVEKIYKGMRLFLYNIDDKMMYGIFKATSPGGYNIEPKAFNSKFPSQVRFAVLQDCKPLPEEKFKAAIKSNYTGRKNFKVELSPEQVRDLCKLFTSETKGQKPRSAGEGASKASDTKGRKPKSAGEGASKASDTASRGGASKAPRREVVSKAPRSGGRSRNRSPPRKIQRRGPYNPRGQTYPRESYGQPAPLPASRYPSYPYAYETPAYETPANDYYYRREPVEYRDPYRLSYAPPQVPVYPAAAGLSYAPHPAYRY